LIGNQRREINRVHQARLDDGGETCSRDDVRLLNQQRLPLFVTNV
jgi:hypothetical protein